MNLLYFLINTNIFISLAAVFLTIETQIQLGMKPQMQPYLFLIFFATLFEYNLHRLITVVTSPDAAESEKYAWVKKNKTSFYALVTFSIIGFICSALLINKIILFALAPIGILTLFYSLPVFKTKHFLFRLREIPFLKIFIISMVWSASTILLPLIDSGNTFNNEHLLLMLTERFLFIFAITLPFDIRDLHHDKQTGLKTFPVVIGEKKSLVLANILLSLFLLICSLHYRSDSFLLFAFLLSSIITFIFLNNSRVKNLNFYHYGILDGTMLLQGFLVLLLYYTKAI